MLQKNQVHTRASSVKRPRFLGAMLLRQGLRLFRHEVRHGLGSSAFEHLLGHSWILPRGRNERFGGEQAGGRSAAVGHTSARSV